MKVAEVKEKIAPVLRSHGIARAAVFGSVARGDDRPDSDVDLLVRFGTPMGMFGYMRLIEELENALGRRVDVVSEKSVIQRMRPAIKADAQVIYESQ